MKILFKILLISFCCNSSIYAQNEVQATFYFLQLKDKNNSPFSLENPSIYLSDRALQRRAAMGIAIDSTDLPVNPLYISEIANTGAAIFATTRWLNGVTVCLNDSATILPVLRNINFIKKIEYTGVDVPASLAVPSLISLAERKTHSYSTTYGSGFSQINQLNGLPLHQRGFRGAGVQIAVIDGGFTNADSHIAFDSLRNAGGLLGTHDFAYKTDNAFCRNTHGSAVLSTMASNVPGTLIGTAPDAAYWLLLSERTQGEYPVEADLWISAAEFADSVGVDIITTSLGYTVFDDSSLNYNYLTDLNGQTIRASRAADIAAGKGIVTLNAVGNEGRGTWHYISVPADAQQVISVGAVNSAGLAAGFSSYGPTADGRVKPELSAEGVSAAIGNFYDTNQFTTSGGTSFATPILAGMTACLLQALKVNNISYSPETVKNALIHSTSLYPDVDDQKGYGVPNFETAFAFFLTTKINENQTVNYFEIKKESNFFNIKINIMGGKNEIAIFDALGQCLRMISTKNSEILIDNAAFRRGILFVKVQNEQFVSVKKIIN
ncbi:MAG: S8 family peptidase [Prevotellaceae bacterium]|jgi:subtilase family serine protease|nr:S8 family peptidase [Prevotellaceae bacterium]